MLRGTMAYNSKRPVTSANCPTRDALEKDFSQPNTPWLRNSIHARHSLRKTEQHRENVARRSSANAGQSRIIPKAAKAK